MFYCVYSVKLTTVKMLRKKVVRAVTRHKTEMDTFSEQLLSELFLVTFLKTYSFYNGSITRYQHFLVQPVSETVLGRLGKSVVVVVGPNIRKSGASLKLVMSVLASGCILTSQRSSSRHFHNWRITPSSPGLFSNLLMRSIAVVSFLNRCSRRRQQISDK